MHPLLSQGRQDSGLARIKSGGSLQCGISDWPMTGWGHKLALPHCNILSRFAPISGHYPKAATQETLTRKTGRLGGVFQPPNRADILRLTYSKISEIGITAKACLASTDCLPTLYSDPTEVPCERSTATHLPLVGTTSA